MKTDELREKFLSFFKAKGHRIFASDSLVPQDDPTVLFSSAGMNQFKPQFMGKITDFRRAASCQKCLRTDDLDKVGKTADHHTFFEMLGNFSFGDYFKEEAIIFAWEFLRDILKISPERIWISVYKDDDEAYDIWSKKIKIPRGKILRLTDRENFWPSEVITNGPNGPCGPCSEIFFDQGEDVGCGKADCNPSCNCGRFIELWNLVFTQFNRGEDENGRGYLEPLPQKNIDTGMGLERMARVLQGVGTNFEIDIFKPIVEELLRQAQDPKLTTQNAIYAIADHIRAVTFAISDGVTPSNEERGYIIRKLIRKGFWQGRNCGLKTPFLYKLVPVVARLMGKAYPELLQRRENISQIVLAEEERFKNTLEEGENLLVNLMDEVRKKKVRLIEGEIIFRLYDTYGFPVELTQLIAQKEGFQLDMEGFLDRMDEQRSLSKARSKMGGEVFSKPKEKIPLEAVKTEFVGYDAVEVEAQIEAIIKDDTLVEVAQEGDSVGIVLDKSPFYAEAGGQIGDTGRLLGEGLIVKIEDTKKFLDIHLHIGKIIQGKLRKKDRVVARLELERRLDIARNHTATHLLQAALREVLGPHIEQAGSWVGPQSLRFDFTHFKSIPQEKLRRIEEKVNFFIRKNDKLKCELKELQQAKKEGALAFFGEKYQDVVRVVSIGDYSKELCGGTHLESTGEIGLFLINSETSVAAGVRRIEATTGRFAYKKITQARQILDEITQNYKISEEDIPNFLEMLSRKLKTLEKALRKLKQENFQFRAEELLKNAKSYKETKIVFHRFDEPLEILREYMDILKRKAKTGLIVLASGYGEKVTFLIGLTPDLKRSLNANLIANELGAMIGGSGGGRADLAQAGAKDKRKLTEIDSAKICKIVEKMM